METLAIFFMLEFLGGYLAFFYFDINLPSKVIVFVIFFLFIAPMFTLHMNDMLIRIYLKMKKIRGALRLYRIKDKVVPGLRAQNGVRLNMVPLYFKIGEFDKGAETLEKIDFLILRREVLKVYFYLLKAFVDYKREIYENFEHHLDAALGYKVAKDLADAELLKCASHLKKGEKVLAKEIFSKLPKDYDSYLEPFDDLYDEIKKEFQ